MRACEFADSTPATKAKMPTVATRARFIRYPPCKRKLRSIYIVFIKAINKNKIRVIG
jgi:hypothetical protein